MAHDVFVSHSSKDKPTADAVCAVLEAQGIRCWVAPRDILPGRDWGASIIGAIKDAKVMVLIFSSHANSSPQINREIERAVHKGIPIIPMRIEEVLPTESLEYFLSSPHWLDAFSPPLEKHLQYLTQVVRQIIDGPITEIIPVPAADRELREKAESTKLAEEKRLVDEQKRQLDEEKRQIEEQRRLMAEEKRQATETAKLAEEDRKQVETAEVARIAKENSKVDEERAEVRLPEAVQAQVEAEKIKAPEAASLLKEKRKADAALRTAEEEAAAPMAGNTAKSTEPNQSHTIKKDLESRVAEKGLSEAKKYKFFAISIFILLFACLIGYLFSIPPPQEKRTPQAPIEPYMKYYNYGYNHWLAGNSTGIGQSNYNEALIDCNNSIELKPDFADAYNLRGKVKLGRGDYDSAVADFNKAIELKPDFEGAYCQRAIVKELKNDWEGAITDYNKALTINPRHGLAYCWLGEAKEGKGDLSGALSDYQKAVELDPVNSGGQFKLNALKAKMAK